MLILSRLGIVLACEPEPSRRIAYNSAPPHAGADLPLFRRSITPRAVTWKSRQQPSSRASTLLTGYSVSLTRITSVLECAVSSVGFLWGSAAVSLSCGVSVGSPKPLTGLADPARVPKSRRLPDPNDHFPVTQCHQGDLARCNNSAPCRLGAHRVRCPEYCRGTHINRSGIFASAAAPTFRAGGRPHVQGRGTGKIGERARRRSQEGPLVLVVWPWLHNPRFGALQRVPWPVVATGLRRRTSAIARARPSVPARRDRRR
jgi:hypothetical protein